MWLFPKRWPPAWVWLSALVLTVASAGWIALGGPIELLLVVAVVILVIGAPSTAAHWRGRWDEEARDDL